MGVKIDSKKLKEVTKLEFIDDSDMTWTPATTSSESQSG